MLDVARLRVLVAVARHGSVTAAAKALHYAQPSVSHHLARLEAEWAGDRLADHADRRWIGGCERCREELLRACAAEGFTPDIRFTTDDYVAAQQLVASGLGVTTLPALALAGHRNENVRVVPLPGRARRISVAVAGEPPDPPATRALVERIRASSPRPPAAAPARRSSAGPATRP